MQTRRFGGSRGTVAVLAAALTVLGGCSSGGSPDNACDLLTTSQADQLLGGESDGPVEDTDRSDGTYCQWTSEQDDRRYLATELDQGTQAVEGFEFRKARVQEEGAGGPEPGLGDDAFFDDVGELYVRSGDRVFAIFTEGSDSAGERAARKRAAAELILDELGEPGESVDVTAAAECARTERCISTRYHACDVLADEEVTRITGWTLDRVDGTVTLSASRRAGLCRYYLEDPAGLAPFNRTAEVAVEPDRDPAEQGFREARKDARGYSDYQELPALGPDAFHLGPEVHVLKDGVLLTLQLKGRVAGGGDDRSPEIVAIAVELASAARARL